MLLNFKSNKILFIKMPTLYYRFSASPVSSALAFSFCRISEDVKHFQMRIVATITTLLKGHQINTVVISFFDTTDISCRYLE
jgi:hypothetical protein